MNFSRRLYLSIAFGVLASVAYAADQKGFAKSKQQLIAAENTAADC